MNTCERWFRYHLLKYYKKTRHVWYLKHFFAIAIGLNFLTLFFLFLLIYSHKFQPVIGMILSIFLFIVLLSTLAISLLTLIYQFPAKSRYLSVIVKYYFSIILIFASFYIILVILDGPSTINKCFQGMSALWSKVNDKFIITQDNIINLYIDSLYFSVATSATLGFGDIVPKTIFAKTLTMLQVLLSIVVSIFAVGRYFASTATKD